MTTIGSMKKCADSLLKLRAQLGADLHKIYIVTRVWSGEQIGDGEFEDHTFEVLPTPGIKDYSHSLRVAEGGNYKQGDLIIHQISKNQFPLESDVDCSSDSSSIEKLYKVGQFFYRVVSVIENQITWNVQIRRLTDQSTRGE